MIKFLIHTGAKSMSWSNVAGSGFCDSNCATPAAASMVTCIPCRGDPQSARRASAHAVFDRVDKPNGFCALCLASN
jgi:hypothetical protein